ncbi:MAG: hypothetical protein ACXABY_11390 [Candidatus Thorarchaeota archaeon]|jgi:hypothetical protein
MRPTRGIIALAIILVMIVAGSLAFLSDFTPPVAPPDEPPSGAVEPVIVDDLQISATAYFWQDFMPAVPPEGPPFYLVIRVNATNLGNTTVFGLDVFTVTVYFGDSLNILHTFKIEPGLSCCFDEFSVAPNNTELFEFTNDRETIFSPEIEEGTSLYAQVQLVWDTGQAVLTTPPALLGLTH